MPPTPPGSPTRHHDVVGHQKASDEVSFVNGEPGPYSPYSWVLTDQAATLRTTELVTFDDDAALGYSDTVPPGSTRCGSDPKERIPDYPPSGYAPGTSASAPPTGRPPLLRDDHLVRLRRGRRPGWRQDPRQLRRPLQPRPTDTDPDRSGDACDPTTTTTGSPTRATTAVSGPTPTRPTGTMTAPATRATAPPARHRSPPPRPGPDVHHVADTHARHPERLHHGCAYVRTVGLRHVARKHRLIGRSSRWPSAAAARSR